MIIDKRPDRNSLVGSVFSVNILVILCIILNFQHIVNASCVFTDGQRGKCVSFEECPSAIILSQIGVTPAFCNLEQNTVCCVDNRNVQPSRLPASGTQRRPTQRPQASNTYVQEHAENDPNSQRKKHSVGNSNGNNNGNTFGKRKNSEYIDEPYKYETPNTFYSESEVTNKPSRRPSRPKTEQNEDNYFVPPGIAKKKPWRDEKTTENDYYFEHVTKKQTRGPNRKGSNKHTGNGNSSNDSRKWGDVNPTRRPEWQEQGETQDSYYGQNEYENEYSNQRPTTTRRNSWEQETYTTTRRNSWGQDTYTTTRRPNYNGGGGGNYYPDNNDDYFKPTRQPPTSAPSGNKRPNRPNHQGSQNNGNRRPVQSQGTNFENNGNRRPVQPQGTNFENNPNYQQRPSSRPGPQKRKRISEQKCEEYSKQITENITGLPLTTDPDPVVIPVRKCITPQQLIVGGENTTLGEFPHMAAVGFREKNQIAWKCGGTLISDHFVLTAAHCTSSSSGRPVKVRLGEYDLKKNDDGAYPVDYAIVDIITHPEYRPPSKYNDIALLKLSRKVTFFKHIRPACLYSEETFSASKAIATGWGRLQYGGATSDILQKVVLSIVDNYTCNRLYKVNIKTQVLSRGIVESSQICAGELSGGKDTCQGDSGGPLSITSSKCIHHVIGVTSFGKSCALPNSTGVYTRVSAYVPWIESIVWARNYD